MDSKEFVVAHAVNQTVSLGELTPLMRANGDFVGFGKALADYQMRLSAKTFGIEITDADLQQEADVLRRSFGLMSRAETLGWLNRTGRTVETFEAGLEASILRRRLMERVATPEKVEARFEREKHDLASIALAQIELPDIGTAEGLRERLNAGKADFAEAAAEHSLDRVTAPGGGFLGWRTRGSLPPPLAEILFDAASGTVLGPIQMGQQVFLYKVIEIRLAELDESTRRRMQDAVFADWLSTEIDRSGLRLREDL